MSDLDDLELIAEASKFGFRSVAFTGMPAIKKPFLETCKRGHPREGNTTIRKVGRRKQLVCRICRQIDYRARRARKRQASGSDAGRINPA